MNRRKRRRSQRAGTEGLLTEVADAARLHEGPEGVRRILRQVFRRGPIPIRDLARSCVLPVPVVAAVRGELEKREVVARKGGLVLTEFGTAAVASELGLQCRRRFTPRAPFELPDDFIELLERVREIWAGRPDVDVTLDQSHATPETALQRAVYLFEHDALEGRDLLILGDDDLTSIAVCLLAQELECRLGSITVLELDERLVEFISENAGAMGPVEAVRHDLRAPLPGDLLSRFDAFFTDPPYTLAGLELFVSRGVSALRPEPGKQGFICFGHRDPRESAQAVRLVVDMGLGPAEVLPAFNRYEGAQVLAGISQMIRTVSTGELCPAVIGEHQGPLYTAECRPRRKPHAG